MTLFSFFGTSGGGGGGVSIGDSITGGNPTDVLFVDGSGTLGQDNNFTYSNGALSVLSSGYSGLLTFGNAGSLYNDGFGNVTLTNIGHGQQLSFISTGAVNIQDSTGSGSGITITGGDTIINHNLQASGLNYPTSDGSNGYVMTTDGVGNLTLQILPTNITSLNTSLPLTGGPITTTGTIGIQKATGAQDGYLQAADWTTFNNKQTALTFSTGLASNLGVVTANLSTGSGNSQNVVGATIAGGILNLTSTINATKGSITFGNSIYAENVDSLSLIQSVLSSANTSTLVINPTWNTSGSPTALLINTVNTASGASSKLMDLQVGTVSQFNINRIGKITLINGSNRSTGTTTLVGGTILVNNTAVTASSLIWVQYATGIPAIIGVGALGILQVTSISAGLSFTIKSLVTATGLQNMTDNSTVQWWIIN